MNDWTPWRAIEDGDGLWDVVDSRDDLVAFGMTEDAARKLVETPALIEALEDCLLMHGGNGDLHRDVGRDMRAALARARGEE